MMMDNYDIDSIDLIDFNLPQINTESESYANSLVKGILQLYYDEKFINENPSLKKRMDNDIESLRILFKMRKADEEAHDLIINAISGNSGNASLYKSLTDIQRTILSITNQIREIIESLIVILKGYQIEIPFNKEDNDSENTTTHTNNKNLFRGSKAFIQDMSSHISDIKDSSLD